VILTGCLAVLVMLHSGAKPMVRIPESKVLPIVAAPIGAAVTTAVLRPAIRPAVPSLQLVNEIARALRTGNETDRARAFTALLPELIAMSPRDAGLLAEEWEAGPLRDELLSSVIRLWTATDFAGAMTWLAGLESRRDRRNAAEAGAAEIARTDPAGAIEVSQIFQAGIGDGSLEHLVQIWTEESPREAVDWAVGRPAGLQRDLLLARIAYVRAQQDPLEAATLAVDFMTPGPVRDGAIAAVARQWAVRDPAAASAWVGQFPAGSLRTRSIAAVETGWKSH
jgi:hypothetical protein